MKKLTILIATLLLCAATLLAQSPEKFTYQAVVRNASNALVSNTLVGVRVSILQGSATGNGVYVETQMPSTNANGLITLNIGDGNVVFGSFDGIDWSAGPFFLKTEIDPNGGNDYSVTSIQQLMSVPYALYAKEAGNGFSGDYNDLTNLPQIPQIPADVSAFNNDAGYLTSYTETDPNVPAWAKEATKPAYDYSEIANTPTIPTVPTNVSAFDNDAGYITGYTETDPQFNAWDKDYNDLTNLPQIPQIPADVSAFNNDVGYLTSFTEQQVLTISNDTLFLTGGSFVKLPAGFDGDYNSLTNKPLIPTSVGELTNDANYITLEDVPNIPSNVSAFTNDAGYITGYTETDPQFNAWDKDYNDLTNKPVIPTVPTNVSAFNNDAGYITEADVQEAANVPTNLSAFTNDAGYITSYTETDPNVPAWAKEATKPAYDYSEIANTPTIPTVPANVSAFTNDAGYITMDSIPAIPTVPTNVSAFTNDAGYITVANVQEAANIPTNVSAFNNDAGYLTSYTETDPNVPAWAKEATKPAYDYSEIANTPVIPTVPMNVSAFVNDVPYLTSFTEQQVLTISNDTVFLTGGSYVKLPEGFSGDYNDLINKPEIPEIPDMSTLLDSVSAIAHDAGYITMDDLQGLLDGLYSTIDSLRSRIEELENGNTPVVPDTTQVTPSLIDGQPCPAAPTLTDYEGNVYNTVQIGNQCWMKENLKTTKYADGTSIPSGNTVSSIEQFYYDFTSSNIPLESRGYLYNWPAVMHGASSSAANPSRVQGICPTGWHVPSDAEWMELENYVSGQGQYLCDNDTSNIAKALAASSGWTTYTTTCAVGNDLSSNNATGFSAFPGGLYYEYGCAEDHYAHFWSSTKDTSGYVWYRCIMHYYAYVWRNKSNENRGYSVRCLRDADGGSTVQMQPTVTTDQPFEINTTSVTLKGTVFNPDNITISSMGFEWKATVGGNYTTVDLPSTTMSYKLTGLADNTGYTYRAFVSTAEGAIYGDEVNFTTFEVNTSSCLETILTDYDGNAYNTVLIGNQCWMKENLRTTHYSDGTAIELGSNTSGTKAYYYIPNGSSEYGYLYNWKAVMRSSTSSQSNPSGVLGICPVGWHVPSEAEWVQLEDYVSSQSQYLCGNNSSYIAKALAATSGWTNGYNSSPCAISNYQGDNNATGFGALPAGDYMSHSSSFGIVACFWSSTEASVANEARYCHLSNESMGLGYGRYYKSDGYSVRCLRDETGGGTAQTQPSVTTGDATDITSASATLNGTVINTDNVTFTAQGFEWKRTEGDNYTTVNASGTTMSYNLTGLTANSGYTYRAFVMTEDGAIYGEEVSFITLINQSTQDAQSCPAAPTVTDYDGNIYNTVQIGNQCWMKENLRTTHFANGDSIIVNPSLFYTNTAYIVAPNGNNANVATYGYLYNWVATMHGASSSSNNPSLVQGVCPMGWHVPSDAEWDQLNDYVSSVPEYLCEGNSGYIAKSLGASFGWNTSGGECWVGNDLSANNATGFSALPTGCNTIGCYNSFGYNAYYWSATESDESKAFTRSLEFGGAYLYKGQGSNKNYLFSVRCLRD